MRPYNRLMRTALARAGYLETTFVMLLLVDIGNTNTGFGVATAEGEDSVESWRMSSARDRTADEWFAMLSPHLERAVEGGRMLTGMIVSSVVPAITNAIVDYGRRFLDLEPLLVGPDLDLGIRIRVDTPAEVGTDRLVNCAYAYLAFGGPTVVVDMGTATKIEAIAASGDYLGGVIAPGLGLTLDALASRAARLYAVELKLPPAAIGRNTVAAVQSGVVTGHLAMVEGMISRVASELGVPRHVVLTGGFSGAIAGQSKVFTDYVPDLTLRGLRFLYLKNRVTSTS
jgi:type III pantothenate kinase